MALKVKPINPIGDFFGGIGGFLGDTVNNISHVIAPQQQTNAPHTYNKPVFGVQQNPTNPLDYLGNFGAGVGNSIASSVGLIPDLTNSGMSVFQDQWHKDQAANQLAQDWNSSIPGATVNNAVHVGGAIGNTLAKDVNIMTGNQAQALAAEQRAKDEFNQTVFKAPYELANVAGSTMAANDLLNKGTDPRIVQAALQGQTGLDPTKDNTPQLVQDAIGAASLPLSAAGLKATGSAVVNLATRPRVGLKAVEEATPTRIPVTKQDGGDVPIPVRVNTKIPVRSIPSDDILNARLKDQTIALQQGYNAEMKHAMSKPELTRNNLVQQIEAKYSTAYDNLVKQHADGTLPKKIVVQDAPTGPKVTSKKPAQQLYDGPTMTKEQVAAEKQRQQRDDAIMGKSEIKPRSAPDMLTLNSKIKNVKDPVRRAELIAERDAKFPKQDGGDVLPTEKGPGVIRRIFQTSRDIVRQHGTGGEAAAHGLQNARDIKEVFSQAYFDKVPTVMKLNDKEFTQFWDTVEALGRGEKPGQVSAKVGKAVDEHVAAIPTVRQHAQGVGLEVGDQGKFYLPHEYKDLQTNPTKFAQNLVKSGQAKNMEDAMNQMHFAKAGDVRSYGHLEKSRTGNMGGYEKTKQAYANYIGRSYDRIGKAQEFGAKGEKLDAMRAQADKEGYDTAPGSNFDKALQVALENVDRNTTLDKSMSVVRQGNAGINMETSALANANQPVNTAVVGGFGRTIKGYAKLIFSPQARKDAYSSGVVVDEAIKHAAGAAVGTTKQLFAPFFKQIETSNRLNAAIVGKDWGNKLAKQAANGDAKALDVLRNKLHVSGELNPDGSLTRVQQIQAARGLVEKTQFKVDPQDLATWMDHPVAKTAIQFKPFGIKQTAFVWHEVLKEAKGGNLLPLIRYVTLATPAGMVTGGVRSAIKLSKYQGGNILDTASTNFQNSLGLNPNNDKNAPSPAQAAFNGFMNAGGLGIASSEPSNYINAANYDKQTGDTSSLPGALVSTVAGPAGSTAVQAAVNIDKGINDGNWRPAAKQLVGAIPGAGSSIANLAFPNKQFTPGKTDPSKLSPDDLKKFEGASYDEFKNSLDKGSQDIFGLQQNKDASTLALRNGKVNQNQLDDMQAKYNRYKQSVGLPIDYINSLTPEQFGKLDKPTQALVTEASLIGAKKFGDKTTVDPTAKAAIESAKQNAWPNTGDIQPTNKLALDYVNTLKKMQDVPDDQGQQYELYKSFWKGAVKAQYSDAASAGYGSSIADLRRLSGGVTLNGKTYSVKRSDLDSMVNLDDRLLVAGLIDSPKFSNKTRAEAGYPPAPTSSTDGVGYSGSSSSSGGSSKNNPTANPYQYAISRTAGGAAPKVRVKAPSSGGSTKVAFKKGNSKPKVSIKKSLV